AGRDHHALREQALRRLVISDEADIAHHFGEEARVDQVQDGVLDAAYILIDREPIGDLLRIERHAVVARVTVPIEIPRRIDERVHGICLATGRAFASRTRDIYKFRHVLERRAARTGDLHVRGQHDRQILVTHWHHTALRTVNDRNRRTPITLPGDT